MIKFLRWLGRFGLAIDLIVTLCVPSQPLAETPTKTEKSISVRLALNTREFEQIFHSWRSHRTQGDVSAQGGVRAIHNQTIVIECFYEPVLTYLESGDSNGTSFNVQVIQKHLSEHPQQVDGRINKSTDEPYTRPSSTPLKSVSLGTAWPITSGYVVTSDHLISGSDDVVLIDSSGQQIAAWAVVRDEFNDIALLEVNDSRKLPPALPLARSQARMGARVFTIGFPRPDVMGKSPKLFDGIIAGVNGFADDPRSYQTTVPIQPGNSGGPLVNMNGEVVGVVTSMIGIRDEENGNINVLQNASYVKKIQCVIDLLGLLPHQESVLNQLPHHSDDLEVLAGRLQGSVLIVVAK